MNEIIKVIEEHMKKLIDSDFPKEEEYAFFTTLYEQIDSLNHPFGLMGVATMIKSILYKDKIKGKKVSVCREIKDSVMVSLNPEEILNVDITESSFEFLIPTWFKQECINLYEEKGVEGLATIIDSIKENANNIKKQKEKYRKNKIKTLNLYSKLLEFLNGMEEKEYISIPSFIYDIEDTTILHMVINSITEYNQRLYHHLQRKNLSIDDYNKYKDLLHKYGYMFDVFSSEERNLLMESLSLESLNNILSLLQSISFSIEHVSKENFLYIIINTEESILKNIIKLIDDKKFTKQFFLRHIGLTVARTQIEVSASSICPLYNDFENNLSCLSCLPNFEYLMKNNPEIFLMPSTQMKESMDIIEAYGIHLENETSKVYKGELLQNLSYLDYVDELIEMGFYEYIKDHPEHIKENTANLIIRLSMMQNIGAPVFNEQGRLQSCITSGKNFYVRNDELEKYRIYKVEENIANDYFDVLQRTNRYYISNNIIRLECIQYLDAAYKYSEYEYRIEDIIISRKKVQRNVQALLDAGFTDVGEIIFASMTYHSTLNKEQIELLKNITENYDIKIYQKTNKNLFS